MNGNPLTKLPPSQVFEKDPEEALEDPAYVEYAKNFLRETVQRLRKLREKVQDG